MKIVKKSETEISVIFEDGNDIRNSIYDALLNNKLGIIGEMEIIGKSVIAYTIDNNIIGIVETSDNLFFHNNIKKITDACDIPFKVVNLKNPRVTNISLDFIIYYICNDYILGNYIFTNSNCNSAKRMIIIWNNENNYSEILGKYNLSLLSNAL